MPLLEAVFHERKNLAPVGVVELIVRTPNLVDLTRNFNLDSPPQTPS